MSAAMCRVRYTMDQITRVIAVVAVMMTVRVGRR
jgi:hypothetical protein